MDKEWIEQKIEEAHANAVDKGFYDCPKCKGKDEHTKTCKNCSTGNERKNNPNACIDKNCKCPLCLGSHIDPNKNTGELLMLIVSELGEALEAHRTGKFTNWDLYNSAISKKGVKYGAPEKFLKLRREQIFEMVIKDTFEDEIADVFIRLFDLCGYLGINPSPSIPDAFKYNTDNVGEILLYITRNVFDISLGPDREYNISAALYYLWCAAVNSWGIDIKKHIEAKMEYNKTRPRKHGKSY